MFYDTIVKHTEQNNIITILKSIKNNNIFFFVKFYECNNFIVLPFHVSNIRFGWKELKKNWKYFVDVGGIHLNFFIKV